MQDDTEFTLSDYPDHEYFHGSRLELSDIYDMYGNALKLDVSDTRRQHITDVRKALSEAITAVESLLGTYPYAPKSYALLNLDK